MSARNTMHYRIFAFWLVVAGLIAARVAYHDRIAAGMAEQPRPAAHAMSTLRG